MKRTGAAVLLAATLLASTGVTTPAMAQPSAPAPTATGAPRLPVHHIGTHIGEDDRVRYTVRRGDTLYTLAADYMHSPLDWRAVQRLNRVRDPLRLLPGSTLIIPAALLKTLPLTARIAAFKGTGTIATGSGAPAAMAVNQAVTPGMVIELGRNSFATLLLSNGSRLTLPSQTRLRVATIRRFQLNDMVDVGFLLEKGRVETRATPLGDSGGRYRIRTPIAVSAVRGTTFRAAYEGEGAPSLTEVIDGTVAVSAGTDASAQAITRGFGVTVSPQGAMSGEPLLAAPELLNPGRVQTDPQITFALQPLQGATGYHVQIARDAGFVEMEQEGYSRDPLLRFEDIGNGRWFVRVSALAATGLEGMPQTYAMRRVLIGLSASSDRSEDGGYRFRWTTVGEGRDLYHFRLRRDEPASPPLVDETGLTDTLISLSDLPPGKYRWSVGVQHFEDGEGTTSWLPEETLIVANEKGSARTGAR